MKKLYKFMLAALFSILCFVPLSVSAEESSTFVFDDDMSFLSDAQMEFFMDFIFYDYSSYDDVLIYSYYTPGSSVSNRVLYFVTAITNITDNGTVYFNDRFLINYQGEKVVETTQTRTVDLYSENFHNFILKYNGVLEYGSDNIPKVTVSTSVSGSGGSVTGSGVYPITEWFTVEAYPDFGYEFVQFNLTYTNFEGNIETSVSTLNPYIGRNRDDITFEAVFRYTGISPTPPPPTPTPDPEGPSYEMNTDFKYLLSNPAIASLVQYAVNELNSNTWWIDREIYNYSSASCPSGSTPLYSIYGYVERFVLYNFDGSSVVSESDSINHQGQSSIGCLIDGTSSQVVIPTLNTTPTITETLFFGFDLFEIPQADFYELLSDIRDLLATPDNSINNTITSGNSISQNATSSIVDTNSALADSSQTYEQFESQFNSNLTSSLDNIDVNSINLVNSNDFVKTASWVKIQFDDILDSSGIYKTAISFVLIIGLALLLLGRRL